MRIIYLLPLLFFSQAFASVNFQAGVSAYNLNIKDPKYRTIQSNPQTNLNVGISYSKDKNFISFSTNRLFNQESKTKVERNNYNYDVEAKTYVDTVSLGRIFGRVMPSLFIGRADVEKKLLYNKKQVGITKQVAAVYGASLSYFITPRGYASLILVAPQPRLYLKSGIGINLTYLF